MTITLPASQAISFLESNKQQFKACLKSWETAKTEAIENFNQAILEEENNKLWRRFFKQYIDLNEADRIRQSTFFGLETCKYDVKIEYYKDSIALCNKYIAIAEKHNKQNLIFSTKELYLIS